MRSSWMVVPSLWVLLASNVVAQPSRGSSQPPPSSTAEAKASASAELPADVSAPEVAEEDASSEAAAEPQEGELAINFDATDLEIRISVDRKPVSSRDLRHVLTLPAGTHRVETATRRDQNEDVEYVVADDVYVSSGRTTLYTAPVPEFQMDGTLVALGSTFVVVGGLGLAAGVIARGVAAAQNNSSHPAPLAIFVPSLAVAIPGIIMLAVGVHKRPVYADDRPYEEREVASTTPTWAPTNVAVGPGAMNLTWAF